MRRFLAASVGAAALAVIGSSAAVPPPGATARCADGTYSYSQYRSGTCSHHGGVARWLSAGSGSAGSVSGAQIAVGNTALLASRTKAAGCRLGPTPDRRCSPGAYYPRITAAIFCSTGFHTSSIRHVAESERHAVEIEYGLAATTYGHTLEVDHIVPLELGGSNDIANLFPERADARPGYHAKDRLENRLHALVCSHRLGLRAARIGIASNWRALYDRVFGKPPV
jgi:hypothetical protein